MSSEPRRALSRTERLDWLRLIRTENVGPVTFFALLARFGSPTEALKHLPELAKQGGRSKPLRVATRAMVAEELARLEAAGATLVAACEPAYPPLLANIEDPPPVLAMLGAPHMAALPTVALVGARNASLNGRRFTEVLVRDLAAAGFVVVSGFARGIDTAAHTAALATGTIAVMAGGIDIVYPQENTPLYRQVAEQGLIVAESPPGTQPQGRHFPRRNRIISGLCYGVVVVEAARKSGSLITARLAGEQGREVFAVPGSPLDPRAEGCNDLIADGATLVRSARDIIPVLSVRHRPLAEPRQRSFSLTPPPSAPDERELAAARPVILESLSPTPVPVDDLIRDCQFSAPVVLTVLLELEMAGRGERQPGNRFALL